METPQNLEMALWASGTHTIRLTHSQESESLAKARGCHGNPILTGVTRPPHEETGTFLLVSGYICGPKEGGGQQFPIAKTWMWFHFWLMICILYR